MGAKNVEHMCVFFSFPRRHKWLRLYLPFTPRKHKLANYRPGVKSALDSLAKNSFYVFKGLGEGGDM